MHLLLKIKGGFNVIKQINKINNDDNKNRAKA